MSDPSELHFGPYRLLGRYGPLMRGSKEIRLQPKALALLWTLARQAGEVVTKAALLDALWPDEPVTEDALVFQITALRKALGDDPRTPRYIVTVHRIGYRFTAPLSQDQPRNPESPFVGRQSSLAALRSLYEKAAGGHRQMAFVMGEPGVGKSALVDQFTAQIGQAQPALRIARGECLDQLGASEPFMPLLQALSRLLRQAGDETLLALMRQVAPGWLLQLPTLLDAADQAALKRQTKGVGQDRMIRELVDALDLLCEQAPILLVLEDLHWSDASTLQLLTLLAQRREPARLMVLCTTRPVDMTAANPAIKLTMRNLTARGFASEMTLGFLDFADVCQYLDQRLPLEQVTDNLKEAVFHRTVGHPLFLGQIASYLAGQEQLAKISSSDLESLLPSGLQALIELQLSALALGEQLVLETASVAGSEFSAAAVAIGAGLTADAVEIHCERLVQQGQFLEERGLAIWPDGTTSGKYRFRHVLYEQTLKKRLANSREARLHRLIGDRLEAAYGARATEIAPELARHFELAGVVPKAVKYCIHNARMALERVAPREVESQTERGLNLLALLPDSAQRRQTELILRVIGAYGAHAEFGFGSIEPLPRHQRIIELLPECQDPIALETAFTLLWFTSHSRADTPQALDFAERLRQLGEHLGNLVIECAGATCASLSLTLAGRIREADDLSPRAMQLAARLDPTKSAIEIEPGFTATAAYAITRWYLGFPDTALELANKAVAGAGVMGNPYSQCVIQSFGLSNILMFTQAYAKILECSGGIVELCLKYGHQDALAQVTQHRAIALCMTGQADHALPQLQSLLATQRKRNLNLGLPLGYGYLAQILMAQGQTHEARAAVQAALEMIESKGIVAWLPEILRIDAELLLLEHPRKPALAETRFRESIALSVQREVRSLQLRATTGLARLMLKRGGAKEARALLTPLYDSFTEGFDTGDLQSARAVLTALQTKA